MKRTSLLFICAAAAALTSCHDDNVDREIAATPVRTEVAKRAEFAPTLALIGVVRASETIPVIALKEGAIAYARRFGGGLRTGETVRAGEVIAEVRNDQSESVTRQARLEMEAARADFDRAKRSYEQGVVSSAEYSSYNVRAQLARERFIASQKDATRQTIAAPRGGRLVVLQPVANGVEVAAGTKLADIASGGVPIVESSVAAADREQLRPGLVVRLSHGAWKGEGKITEVASVIDAAGTARVVIAMTKGDAPPPGTGVDLEVELERRPDILSVPEDAIVAGSEGPAVFVVGTAENWRNTFRVKRVDVETGGHAAGRVEVRGGLRDGDRVVITGVDALSEGTMITESESKS
jgi:RND family efflux transporter MFP subunit